MTRVTAILIFPDKLDLAEVTSITAVLARRQIPVRIFSGRSQYDSLAAENCRIIKEESQAHVTDSIDQLLQAMVSPGLEAALIEDASKILPLFLSKAPRLKVIKSAGFNFDRQLNFSLVAGNLVGLGVFRVKLAAVEKLLHAEKQANALDHFQEAMNQWIGSVAARMSVLGMNAIVGLPTWFDTSTIPELQTLVYFPSVHIADAEDLFAVSVGFVDVTGAQVNLSGIATAVKSEEVEFL